MESRNIVKDVILELVSNGIKGTELVAKVVSALYERDLCDAIFKHNVPDIILDMVDDGDLIEVEYTIPSFPERVRSFYLPKDAEILNYKKVLD